ncbi:glucose-1-phosphate cytidylyltransferase [Aliarcobacter cryaerophilus]|uniref:Glucose-1-phosphate cytidylyltransferase n=1 Tax=Aliarcobacter cryaerophilus TaxID=28198 RepID=A0A2S9TPU7_9BACT|nr:glucose-1-phosphate cytidylyltransferase [Aliarcobacter cryaerophilus]PRN00867.1 glucose-1-phosphate cytidylyltransferase [Arcobacter cryaerophilus gv. pseudocryaerophilus]
MKVLILAGGYGTRLSEETDLRPKPMVEIGGKPILWHIMKLYSHYGFNDFIILLGYKGYYIKEYFANYYLHQSDVTFDMKNGQMEVHNNTSEPWKVTLIDTGLNSMTGGRIKRASKYINNERFMLTYGDGVSDVNIKNLLDFHIQNNSKLTMTAIQPAGRFGALDLNGHKITDFVEKPAGDGNWINGGFMVCEPEILNYIEDDFTVFEQDPLKKLASQNVTNAFKHYGFWQCMDTLRDKFLLNQMWEENKAPWKLWK